MRKETYKNPNRLTYGKDDEKYNHYNFKRYLADMDYEGAAAYAQQFRSDDPNKRNQVDIYCDGLRKHAAKLESLSKVVDPTKRDALRFMYAFDNNMVAPTKSIIDSNLENEHTNTYRQLVGNLGSTNRDRATGLSITIKNDKNGTWLGNLFGVSDEGNTLDLVYNRLGIDAGNPAEIESKLKELGISLSTSTNTATLEFEKSNPRLFDIVSKFDNKLDYDNISIKGTRLVKGEKQYIDDSMEFADTDPYISKNKNLIGLGKIERLVNFINKTREETMFPNSREFRKGIVQDIQITSDFTSEAHAQLYNLYSAGMLEGADYARHLKQLDESMNRALEADLSKTEMYVTTGKDNTLTYAETEMRQNVSTLLKAALQKDGMVSKSAGRVGDTYGTFVTINPANDSNEKPVFKTNIGDRNPNEKEIMIFLPNFENGPHMQALYNDPSSRAMGELSEMKTYGYEKHVSYLGKNGYMREGYLQSDGGGGFNFVYAKEISEDGKTIYETEHFDGNEAQDMLKQNFQYETLQQQISDVIKTNDGKIKDKLTTNELAMLSSLTMGMVRASNPNLNENQVYDKGNEILNQLLREAGFNPDK